MTTTAPGARTLEDHGQRLDRVLAYLAENLDAEVDLERLSRVACFSPFHFHRVYRALQGETVAETVRRMRLHRAAVDLLDDARPIGRIAARAGYGSQAAFTRAFRSAYGAPPAAYRTGASPAGPPTRSRSARSAPARRRAAARGRLHRDRSDLRSPQRARRRSGLLGPSTRYFGIFYDDPEGTPVHALRSDACLTVPDAFEPEESCGRRPSRAGRTARSCHVGPYAELHRAYEWLYREWLLGAGREPGDGPCVEEYLNDPRTTPAPQLRTEVWLPLSVGAG